MTTRTKGKVLVLCLACFAIGSLWGQLPPKDLLAEPTPAKVEATPFPIDARLGANIYMQTSAEYRACCLQVYKCAELRLEALLNQAQPKPERPAVVMDLDETVFDNSTLETFKLKNKLEYTDELWGIYEEKYPQDVALVPGAKRFIQKAQAAGVAVVFISNRSEGNRASTVAALDRLGIAGPGLDDRLYLKEKGATTDKSSRREAVAAKFNVLMFFGDNLRDFSEAFAANKVAKDGAPADYAKAIKTRQQAADDAACHWGIDWFVLPNPVYGEWEKLIGPDPKAILRQSSMVPTQAKP